jgi:NADPH:quinone reductase-like Zn-dependent oxidoreductase
MKAAVYNKTKSGKVLQIIDVETPRPKDNEVFGIKGSFNRGRKS